MATAEITIKPLAVRLCVRVCVQYALRCIKIQISISSVISASLCALLRRDCMFIVIDLRTVLNWCEWMLLNTWIGHFYLIVCVHFYFAAIKWPLKCKHMNLRPIAIPFARPQRQNTQSRSHFLLYNSIHSDTM